MNSLRRVMLNENDSQKLEGQVTEAAVSAATQQSNADCCFNATEIFSIQTGEQSVMLWE